MCLMFDACVIRNTLHFEKVLNAAGSASLLAKKLSPESLKLLQAALDGDSGGKRANEN